MRFSRDQLIRFSILVIFVTTLSLYQNCAPSSGGSAFGINFGGNTTSGSTSPLALSFSTPANNSIISGVTTLTVIANDVNPITSVQFSVDGTNLNAPVTVSPYTTSLNAGTLAGGTHVILASGVDSLGNLGSASISVSVPAGTPVPTPIPKLSCAGSYYVKTSNGYSNVVLTITEATTGVITGSMVFPGYNPYTINGSCTSSSNTSGSIYFDRTYNGGGSLYFYGTYSSSTTNPAIINMSGTFGSYTWTAVTE